MYSESSGPVYSYDNGLRTDCPYYCDSYDFLEKNLAVVYEELSEKEKAVTKHIMRQ